MRISCQSYYTLLNFFYSARLKNIEETEKAKRMISEDRRKKHANDEEHLAAARCESRWNVVISYTNLGHISLPSQSQDEIRRRYSA